MSCDVGALDQVINIIHCSVVWLTKVCFLVLLHACDSSVVWRACVCVRVTAHLQLVTILVWSVRGKDAEDVGNTAGYQQTHIFARVVQEELGSNVKCELFVLTVLILPHLLERSCQQLQPHMFSVVYTHRHLYAGFNCCQSHNF